MYTGIVQSCLSIQSVEKKRRIDYFCNCVP